MNLKQEACIAGDRHLTVYVQDDRSTAKERKHTTIATFGYPTRLLSASKLLLSHFILVLLGCLVGAGASAADALVTLKVPGVAVAYWRDSSMPSNLSEAAGASIYPEGITLGSGLSSSKPTYRFSLPPPRLSFPNVIMTSLTVKVAGSRRTGGIPIRILGSGGWTFQSDLGVATEFTFSADDAYRAVVLSSDGNTAYLSIDIDIGIGTDFYDLKEITVQYSYSGVAEQWLHGYQLACGGANQFGKFYGEVLWGPESGYVISREYATRFVMQTLADLLGGIVSSMAMNLEPIVDLIQAPKEFGGLWDKYGLPLQDSLENLLFWINYPNYPDLHSSLWSSSTAMVNVAAIWRLKMQDGIITSAEASEINRAIDAALVHLQTLTTRLTDAGTYMQLFHLNTGNQTERNRAIGFLLQLRPLTEFDLTTGSQKPEYSRVRALINALEASRPAIGRLTLQSVAPNTGVTIGVAPSDINGNGPGSTPFSRDFQNSPIPTVWLSAPGSASGNTFSKWLRDGVDYANTPNTSLLMDTSHTMTAVYFDPGAPVVVITRPVSTPYYTTRSSTVTLHGSASDTTVELVYTNLTTLEHGKCSGTIAWDTPSIGLDDGPNQIIVTGYDAARRPGSDTITVTRDSSLLSINLRAVQNTFVSSGKPYTAFGGAKLWLGYDANEGFGNQRVLEQFDLTQVPCGSRIESATFQLYCDFLLGSSAFNATIYRLNGSWAESTVKWINQPELATPGLATTIIPAQDNVWSAWDITATVQGWYAGTVPNHGIIVISSVENSNVTNERSFADKTEKVAHSHPTIRLV